jgi:NAD(P)-dependent dehydrogenase (short-subunit alcohol dehydrogenase family)
MPMGSFANQTIWITGAKRIGQQVARELAAAGADLIISYRSSKTEAEAIAREVATIGREARLIHCDTSSRESVKRAVDEMTESISRLDGLVLMASIFSPITLEAISEASWETYFATHVKGTFWPIQVSLPLLNPGAHIITVADRTATGHVYPGYLPYVVTKGAVAHLTRALAAELGPRGIFINAIAPGPILKPDDITSEAWQAIRATSSIKYPITDEEAVEEFVATVVRLLSVRSTGSIYPVDLGHL